MSKDNKDHVWRFFRAGGFDQVRIDRGSDIANIKLLDKKLWTALACPTQGIEFDERTLALIDSDHDGRIRVPELLDAIAWTTAILKNDQALQTPSAELPLETIDDRSERGRAILASAKLILTMLGKGNLGKITLQDTLEVEKIFSATPFNGDGIITADSADDAESKAVLEDVMGCLGSVTDRSQQPGASEANIEQFFADASAMAAWYADAEACRNPLVVFGGGLESAASLLEDLRAKFDDYFARVSLAEVDPRMADTLNPLLATYQTLSGNILKSEDSAIAALPLARIEAGRPLTLTSGVNPAWTPLVKRFKDEVVKPLFGVKNELTAIEWEETKRKFSAYATWMARKPVTPVAKLGPDRIKALLHPSIKSRIDQLVARDKALEPEMNAIADVEKLLRMKRDLMALLNNFASFKDFYTRTNKAVFQAGTLYLDSRSCELCVRVNDDARHSELATLSRIYLAYCRCTRNSGAESMTIAAAFTAGDARHLRVGRNGVFYDRKGRDWDATIIRIVEHPISLRQAFWLPYQQFARMISEMVQKFAAARAAAQQASMAQAAVARAAAAASNTPAQPAQSQQQFDVARFAGIFAAIGLAIGAIGTAIASILTGFLQLAWWQMPLVIAGVVLLISGPSCIIAMIKLQSRNLGPILDACGWAVNTRLKINLPFGRALTSTAELPERAERSLIDPYAEKKRPWTLYVLAVLVPIGGAILWHYGILQQWLGLP